MTHTTPPSQTGHLSIRNLEQLLDSAQQLDASDFRHLSGDPFHHARSFNRALLSHQTLRDLKSPSIGAATLTLRPHWGEHILAGKLSTPPGKEGDVPPEHYGVFVTLRAWDRQVSRLLDSRPMALHPDVRKTLHTWAQDVHTGRLSPQLLQLAAVNTQTRLVLDIQARKTHLSLEPGSPALIQALEALW